MDYPCFGSFIEGGSNRLQSLRSFILLARTQESQVTLFKRTQARLNAAVVQVFGGAAAHATLGGLSIRHKWVVELVF
jgi:hypothetical protein